MDMNKTDRLRMALMNVRTCLSFSYVDDDGSIYWYANDICDLSEDVLRLLQWAVHVAAGYTAFGEKKGE